MKQITFVIIFFLMSGICSAQVNNVQNIDVKNSFVVTSYIDTLGIASGFGIEVPSDTLGSALTTFNSDVNTICGHCFHLRYLYQDALQSGDYARIIVYCDPLSIIPVSSMTVTQQNHLNTLINAVKSYYNNQMQ